LSQDLFGSPEFPSYPCKRMPCSQTPAVSQLLAMARLRLLPSGTLQPVGFPIRRWLSTDRHSTIFRGSIDGLHSRSTLAPHTLLPRSHPGFTTDLLARLWSRWDWDHGASRDLHPLGNISQFQTFIIPPEASDLSRHEQRLVRSASQMLSLSTVPRGRMDRRRVCNPHSSRVSRSMVLSLSRPFQVDPADGLSTQAALHLYA